MAKHRCFRIRISLEVFIGILADIFKCYNNFHSEATEIESSQYHLLFFIIKHAGFKEVLEH